MAGTASDGLRFPVSRPVGVPLHEVLAVLDGLYPPALAADWDTVGLVCGEPGAPVRRVLLAVDPVAAVLDAALEADADLVLTHHPLLLRGAHGIPPTDPRGLVLSRLVRAGVALAVCHTNADVARPGVSDALAEAVGLVDTRPLDPVPGPALDALAVFVPRPHTARVRQALADAGAGRVGDYTEAGWEVTGTGRFRPGPTATPALGEPGRLIEVEEDRVDVVLPRARRTAVLAALLQAHPYEQPAYDLHETAAVPGDAGLGRVGTLPGPEPFRAFVHRVAAAVPATPAGVRAAGDPDAPIRTVAVCGGAGDSLLGAATAAEVDAYVTADLRHHPASDARAPRSDARGAPARVPALVDLTHWASEWPWLPDAAARLRSGLLAAGAEPAAVPDTLVSRTVTDPWTTTAGR